MPFLGDSRRFDGYIGIITRIMDLTDLRIDTLEGNLSDIWDSLRFLERSVISLMRGIELMSIHEAEKPIKRSLLEYQVATLAEGQKELEERVERLEEQVSRIFTLLRVVGIILLVFASVYVAQIVL